MISLGKGSYEQWLKVQRLNCLIKTLFSTNIKLIFFSTAWPWFETIERAVGGMRSYGKCCVGLSSVVTSSDSKIVISLSVSVCFFSFVLFLLGIHIQTTAYQLVGMGTWKQVLDKAPNVWTSSSLLIYPLFQCDS